MERKKINGLLFCILRVLHYLYTLKGMEVIREHQQILN